LKAARRRRRAMDRCGARDGGTACWLAGLART
jgi:hypothetical protein